MHLIKWLYEWFELGVFDRFAQPLYNICKACLPSTLCSATNATRHTIIQKYHDGVRITGHILSIYSSFPFQFILLLHVFIWSTSTLTMTHLYHAMFFNLNVIVLFNLNINKDETVSFSVNNLGIMTAYFVMIYDTEAGEARKMAYKGNVTIWNNKISYQDSTDLTHTRGFWETRGLTHGHVHLCFSRVSDVAG